MVEEAKHFDDGKLGLQYIIAMSGLEDVAKVGDYGAKKYGQHNWRAGSSWMRFAGSLSRHLYDFLSGKLLDHESNLPVLAHLAYDCLILLTWAKEGKGTDDRPKTTMAAADIRAYLDAGVPISYVDCSHSGGYESDLSDCEIIE